MTECAETARSDQSCSTSYPAVSFWRYHRHKLQLCESEVVPQKSRRRYYPAVSFISSDGFCDEESAILNVVYSRISSPAEQNIGPMAEPTAVADPPAEIPDSKVPFDLSTVAHLCALPPTIEVSEYPPTPLRVLNRDLDDPYTFHIVPYTGQPYYALSYAWPSPQLIRLFTSLSPCTIVPPSGPSHESIHLSHFAADALATTLNPTYALWIDHECINQAPTSPEKAAQVAAMDSIYTLAENVLVLLEDVSMDEANIGWLHDSSVSRIGDGADHLTMLIESIMNARWFGRAWCSQEMVLSRHTYFFVHNLDRPAAPHVMYAPYVAMWNAIRRARDESVLKISEPRGLRAEVQENIFIAVGWAAGVVAMLSCWDPWDKIRLVLNLMRVPMEEKGIVLPTEGGVEGETLEVVEENVVKVLNWIAVLKNDFSMLLNGHVGGVRRGGMRWSGTQQNGDFVSERWAGKDYQIAKQRLPVPFDTVKNTIQLSGLARTIESYDSWEIWRDGDNQLWVSVNGDAQIAPSDWLHDSDLVPEKSVQILLDIVYAIEARQAVVIYPYLQMLDEEWDYPQPFEGDLKADIRSRFVRRSFRRHHELARNFATMRGADRVIRFKVVQVDDKYGMPPLLVQGSVEDLQGKTLFQPWVTRPIMFNRLIMTANSMVLEEDSDEGRWRCVGGLRGWGLLLDPEMFPEGSDEVTLDLV